MRDRNVEHHAKSDRHIRITRKIEVIRYGVFDRVIPRADQRKIVRNISEKCLRICRQRVCQQNFFCTADGKQKQSGRHVFRIQFQILFVLKLRHDFRMVNDRSDDQLRKECDKQQIINDIVFFRLSSVCIHQKCDQLKRKK